MVPLYTVAYSPQQNGVAECKNRSLSKMAHCMLLTAGMPNRYWAEAINTATYLQNLLPTKATDKTPFEAWYGKKPNLKDLHVFGSTAFVHVPDQRRSKLDSKAVKLTFVGYCDTQKAYRFVDQETNAMTFSRDARFLEGSRPPCHHLRNSEVEVSFAPTEEILEEEEDTDEEYETADADSSLDGSQDTVVQEEQEEAEEDENIVPEPEAEPALEPEEEQNTDAVRRSKRSTKGVPPNRYGVVGIARGQCPEPRTFKQAVEGPESEQWKAAIEEELQSLHSNKTWDIVDLPAGQSPIGCKWIFKRKEDAAGNVVRYKARLVAQGFTQKYGTDYDEVFAPVVKQTTVRALLSMACRKGMLIKHADVKTAYLNGDLQETVFMRQPPGCDFGPNRVCRLRKGLYGLKQAARIWNQKLNSVLEQMGFKQAESDSCLYVKNSGGKRTFIAVYVDDFVVVCETEELYAAIIKQLNRHFEVTSLGDIKHFLGIQVTRSRNCIALNQKGYIEKLLSRFGLEDAKPSKIPLDPGHLRPKEEEDKEETKLLPNNHMFASLIGSLLYVAVNTRPDIGAAVSILGRKTSCPSQADWNEAKRILKYLKATIDHELILGADSSQLEVFVDATWAGNNEDCTSTTGYLFRYAGGMIGWASRKQTCVTLSSTEAEYVAFAECCMDLVWILRLFEDLGIPVPTPVTVHEDNQSCIKQIDSPCIVRRSKHVQTKYHYVRQLKQEGVINPQYLPSENMIADMMTKPLQATKLSRFREQANIVPLRRSVGERMKTSQEATEK